MNLWCVYCVHMKEAPKIPTAHIIRDGKSLCWNHYKEMYMQKKEDKIK